MKDLDETPMRQIGSALPAEFQVGLPKLPSREIRFPLVISEWRKSRHEVLRISLGNYKGVNTIDVRVWWRDQGGNLNPGKAGITISVKHLEALAVGLANAILMARELGILDKEGQE
jgi:hypothetical protein